MTTTDDVVEMTYRNEDEQDFVATRHSHRRLKQALKKAAEPRPLPMTRCCGRCQHWRPPDKPSDIGECRQLGVAMAPGWSRERKVEKGTVLPVMELGRSTIADWDLMRTRGWFVGCALFAPALGTEDPMRGSFRIVFDGGAEPNPGRGYGSYAIDRIDKPAHLLERVDFDDLALLTNNETEYLTLIQALHRLLDESNAKGRAHVEIVGDSKLVINQVTGDWYAGDPRMRALCDAVRDLLARVGTHSARWQRRDDTVAILGH